VKDTIFSRIVDGSVPSAKLYEDNLTLAFLDINPLTEGHALVISKEAIDHLDDCPPILYSAIFDTVHKLSKHMRKELKPKRIAIVVHGLDIPHAHVHIVPLYTGHEIKLADRGTTLVSMKELKKVAKKIGKLS
jgi:histidine triad (HIT) family protein